MQYILLKTNYNQQASEQLSLLCEQYVPGHTVIEEAYDESPRAYTARAIPSIIATRLIDGKPETILETDNPYEIAAFVAAAEAKLAALEA